MGEDIGTSVLVVSESSCKSKCPVVVITDNLIKAAAVYIPEAEMFLSSSFSFASGDLP